MNTIGPFSMPPGILAGSSGLSIANADRPDSIEQVGKEFESVFVSMLLKSMRETISGDGMFAGDNSDTVGGMFDLFMSQHLSARDSLGIGAMIGRFLDNNQPANPGSEQSQGSQES
jgi:Rod binding domain-containing protein